ncbi:winged helix-turn-helix transcriptional regulator [Nonomuraea typhae]|uniref:Winged helix-turn-helix transcriptional regulator n=1 Tax=Nonomuraea typhae TaxID=2603600 RepID=A0ABW7YV42_9ACTN
MTTLTAAQRRAREQRAHEAFVKVCPTNRLLALISDKWVSLVVSALAGRGTLRYSDLRREIPGVSEKMLTQTLRSMERDGLVTRTVTAAVPPRVDYELTELGRDLTGLIFTVRDWAEANIARIDAARAGYDAAS